MNRSWRHDARANARTSPAPGAAHAAAEAPRHRFARAGRARHRFSYAWRCAERAGGAAAVDVAERKHILSFFCLPIMPPVYAPVRRCAGGLPPHATHPPRISKRFRGGALGKNHIVRGRLQREMVNLLHSRGLHDGHTIHQGRCRHQHAIDEQGVQWRNPKSRLGKTPSSAPRRMMIGSTAGLRCATMPL